MNSSSFKSWFSREKEADHGVPPFTFDSSVCDSFIERYQVEWNTKQIGSAQARCGF